jgi:hypothetical protein
MKTEHLYDPPYAIWTIWRELSTVQKGLVLILGTVFAYSIFLTIRTMLRLYSVWKHPNQDGETVRDAVAALATRYAKLRQVMGATFYLFGLVLFLGLENITNFVGDQLLGIYVLDNFLLLCAFAANAFFIFLMLHSIQWAGSEMLDSLSRRASAHS